MFVVEFVPGAARQAADARDWWYAPREKAPAAFDDDARARSTSRWCGRRAATGSPARVHDARAVLPSAQQFEVSMIAGRARPCTASHGDVVVEEFVKTLDVWASGSFIGAPS